MGGVGDRQRIGADWFPQLAAADSFGRDYDGPLRRLEVNGEEDAWAVTRTCLTEERSAEQTWARTSPLPVNPHRFSLDDFR